MIQNISVRIHPEWSGKISELTKTAEEMKSNPGVTENSAILSSEAAELKIEHPYSKIGGARYSSWAELLPTDFKISPYTLCAKPYAWLMYKIKNGGTKPMRNLGKYGIEVDEASERRWALEGSFEKQANNYVRNAFGNQMSEKSGNFLQLGKDQDNVFKGFFKNVEQEKSLCFIYAKNADFSEKFQRILVGIGRVNKIEFPPKYEGTNPIECELWETRLQHSVTPSSDDCVLLPYDELQEYAKNRRDFNIDEYIVYVSDDFREEFSYGTEWVSYDGAIDTILRTKKTLEKLADLLDISYTSQIKWLDERLQEIYKDRWIYPGLAEMFYAFGLKQNWEKATAYALTEMRENKASFENAIKSALVINDEISALRNWNTWSKEKRSLFELLCRMSLNEKQASKFFNPQKTGQWNSWVDPDALIQNPYLIYEQFSNNKEEDSIPFAIVDNAIFPQYMPTADEAQYELQEPSKMCDSEDIRRVHALFVKSLKKQVERGNTMYPAKLSLDDIRNEVLPVQCLPSAKILDNVSDLTNISETFQKVETNLDGNPAVGFQLKKNADTKEIICNAVQTLADSSEDSEDNWEAIWKDLELDDDVEESENANAAKEEKLSILPYMAKSRIFVLTGGAGTGKTTLLSCIASSRDILDNGILALAPTGKAMVRLRESLRRVDPYEEYISYKTIAQFLTPFGKFNFNTGYNPWGTPDRHERLPQIPQTIIIDECSMLTEDMLAALFKAIGDKADRIILSGDANQLPPIGCGRPFLDILTYFKEIDSSAEHPHYGDHFGELQISMRQDGTNRTDLAFAKCFKRECTRKDLKFFNGGVPNDERLKVVSFDQLEDIETSVIKLLNEDILQEHNKYLTEDADSIDDWEILSPTRRDKFGTLKLNDIVRRAIPDEDDESTISNNAPIKIKVGEKIICTQNGDESKAMDPDTHRECEQGVSVHYVANGDLGYITKINVKDNNGQKKVYCDLIYKGQEPYYHNYSIKQLSHSETGDSEALLEFAYALTVHKCQGSQFKKTLVVLNKYSPMLSRELLYTAFSRQEDKLVILFNDDFTSLQKYCDYTYSEMAKRITNLLATPELMVQDDVCYDKKYIKQDDEVKKLFLKQKEKEQQETKPIQVAPEPSEQVIAPEPSVYTQAEQKKVSVFRRILEKIKSIFSRK